MKTRLNVVAGMLLMVAAVTAPIALAEETEDRAALAKALSTAKASLEEGLGAGAAQGKPISAKFEIEDGKLKHSVYTEKDGKFFEVAVDLDKGTIVSTEAITE